MKKKALPFVLSLLLLMSFTVGSFGQNRDFKSSSGVDGLGNSIVTANVTEYTSGETLSIDFDIIFDLSDGEQITGVKLTFPATTSVDSYDANIVEVAGVAYLQYNAAGSSSLVVDYTKPAAAWFGLQNCDPFTIAIDIPPAFSGNLDIVCNLYGGDGGTANNTITLTEANTVTNPAAVSAVAAGLTSIDLSWSKNGNNDNVMIAYNTENVFGVPSGSYIVGQTISGEGEGGEVIYNGTGTTSTHTGLTSGQVYYYKFFSVNGSKEVAYSDGVELSAITAIELPLTEGFEDGGDMPDGWKLETGDGDNAWAINANAAQTGSYGIRVEQTNDNQKDAWLFTQALDLDAGVTYILDFYYRADGTLEEIMDVCIGAQPKGSSMTTYIIDDLNFSTNDFTFKHTTFTVASDGVYFLGFHAVSAANKDYIDLDDINISTGTAGLWTGIMSTDWSTAANWDNQLVPDATVDVVIPDVSGAGESGNFPIIPDGGKVAATCKDLTIESNALLTVQLDGSLTVSGDLLIESGYFNGAYTGNLVDQTNNGVTITGSVTVQQAILGDDVGVVDDDQWHLIASPVSSFNSSTVFEHCYLRGFDETTNKYVNIGEGVTENTAMKGYATMYSYGGSSSVKTLAFTGALNTGDYNINCTKNNTGWNLVGNPYPSAIDWDEVDLGLDGNLNKTFYVLDGNTQAFKFYMKGGEANTAGQYIPAMNGFFVECNDGAGATFSLENSDRVAQQETFLKEDFQNEDVITLIVAGNQIEDQTTIYFHDMATVGFDRDFDVHKLFSGSTLPPQIYINQNDEFFAVNAYSVSEKPSEVNIGFLTGTSGNYTISIQDVDKISTDISLVLLDTKEGIQMDMRQNDAYSFNYNTSDDPARFKLQFNTTGIADEKYFPFNVWLNGNQLMLNTGDVLVENICLYDLSGKLLKEEADAQNQMAIQLPEIKSVYIIRIQTEEGVYNKKIVY